MLLGTDMVHLRYGDIYTAVLWTTWRECSCTEPCARLVPLQISLGWLLTNVTRSSNVLVRCTE